MLQIKSLERLFVLQRENEHLEVLKQAIYVVCNLASPGVEMHKNAVLASAIPPHLLHYMVLNYYHCYIYYYIYFYKKF